MRPLGVGIAMLEDGLYLPCLVEAEDVRNARDISALGSWRIYPQAC